MGPYIATWSMTATSRRTRILLAKAIQLPSRHRTPPCGPHITSRIYIYIQERWGGQFLFLFRYPSLFLYIYIYVGGPHPSRDVMDHMACMQTVDVIRIHDGGGHVIHDGREENLGGSASGQNSSKVKIAALTVACSLTVAIAICPSHCLDTETLIVPSYRPLTFTKRRRW